VHDGTGSFDLNQPPEPGFAGRRYDAVWPHGYTARSGARLELLDQSGRVVAREGDLLTEVGICEMADGTVLVISIGDVRLTD
jgi:hypothetical protein